MEKSCENLKGYEDITKLLSQYNDIPIGAIGNYLAENRFHEFLLTRKGFIISDFSHVCSDSSDIWAYHMTELKTILNIDAKINIENMSKFFEKEQKLNKTLDEAYKDFNESPNKNFIIDDNQLNHYNQLGLKFNNSSLNDIHILTNIIRAINMNDACIQNCYRFNINMAIKNCTYSEYKSIKNKDDFMRLLLIHPGNDNNLSISKEESIYEESIELMLSHIIIPIYILKHMENKAEYIELA